MAKPFRPRKAIHADKFEPNDPISPPDAASLLTSQIFPGVGPEARRVNDKFRKAIKSAVRRGDLFVNEKGEIKFNDLILWAKETYPNEPGIMALRNDCPVHLTGLEAKATIGDVKALASREEALNIINAQQDEISRLRADLEACKDKLKRDQADAQHWRKLCEKNSRSSQGSRKV